MTVSRRGLSQMSGHSPNQNPGSREMDEVRCVIRWRQLEFNRAVENHPEPAGWIARPINRLALPNSRD